jgi:hypothetical protein
VSGSDDDDDDASTRLRFLRSIDRTEERGAGKEGDRLQALEVAHSAERRGEGEENDRPEWNPGKSKSSVGRAGAAPANLMYCGFGWRE